MRTTFTATLALFTAMIVGCSSDTTDTTDAPAATDATLGDSESMDTDSTDASEAVAPGKSFALSGDNTQVLFTGTKKSGDNHSGGFKTMAGSIGLTDAGGVGSINVVVETESLFSDADRLTGHLKNEDFFSVNEFPELKFESSSIEGDGEVTVTGLLTMHGKTAEISFPANVTVVDGNVTLAADFKVDRTKFGMNFVGKPDDPINADVDIKVIVGE